jgi:hypothetical protein
VVPSLRQIGEERLMDIGERRGVIGDGRFDPIAAVPWPNLGRE